MSMSCNEVRALLVRTLDALPAHTDELRDLDAALGDGDLGITVKAGSAAVVKALAALPDDAAMSDMLRAAGQAFSTANPSTFAALIGGGLLAAAKTMVDRHEVGKDDVLTIGRAVAARASSNAARARSATRPCSMRWCRASMCLKRRTGARERFWLR